MRWLLVSLYLLAGALSVYVVLEANASAAASYTLNQRLAPREKANTQLKTFFGRASFGLYKGGTEEATELEHLVTVYSAHRRKAHLASWGLLGVAAVSLLARGLQGGAGLRNGVSRQLLAVSLLFLLVGLLTPVFSFVVLQDLPILDQVVLKQDSKGVLDTITSLFKANYHFVAVLLFTFSVLTPTLKTVLTFWVLSGRDEKGSVEKLVKGLGKWSMADVFVVALLLAVFSLSSDGLTDARLGLGLYFFAGYVLLSLLAAQLMVPPTYGQAAREASRE